MWIAVSLALLPTTALAHPHTAHQHEDGTAAEREARVAQVARADDAPRGRLTLALIERTTGRSLPVLPGLVRITTAAGEVVRPAELLSRGAMLKADHPGRDWFVLLEETTLSVPRGALVVEAFAGLETEATRREVDLSARESAELVIPLERFSDARKRGWRSGNTHLHLMNMTRPEADRYLATLPRGDHLELVFLSHLRRIPAEKDYISNRYTPGDLAALDSPALRFGWGEEHRHNFGRGGEGYGHVMLLGIRELVRPVSIGPGIMRSGTDAPPLARGIRQARAGGGTVVWCHNQQGLEDVPNWMAGTLDAQNIFDGSTSRDYSGTYYRYMNVGLTVPFSTGTDWFLYDFSRAYVRTDDELNAETWLNGLAAGRSFITNGPLLELTVAGESPGATIELDAAVELPVVARVVGRADFGQVQIVHNGEVVARAKTKPVGGHYEAVLEMPLAVDEPGWIAARIDTPNTNELGEQLFGHTSAVYLRLAGETIFRAAEAAVLLDEMQEAIERIIRESRFADDDEQEDVLDVYRAGIRLLRERIRGSQTGE